MSRVFGFIGAMFASMVRHWRFTLFTGVPLITAIYMLKLKPALDARNAISATLKSPNVSGAVKAHMAAEQSQMMSPIFLWIAILGGVIVGLALIAMLLDDYYQQTLHAPPGEPTPVAASPAPAPTGDTAGSSGRPKRRSRPARRGSRSGR